MISFGLLLCCTNHVHNLVHLPQSSEVRRGVLYADDQCKMG
jgi:hypothetical protein